MLNTTKNQTNTKTQIQQGKGRRQPFLVMDNVYKEYPNGYRALENVNLNVAEGEFITLIGHSGCGKSTLLNMVSGFSHPSQGTVTITGQRITKPGPDRMVVFQGYALLPWRTVF
ncbi:ATP-binding cassette domain-containing protein, partial [Microcoleus sp. HI-ES]|nr:ATP-binding cassette domain-containing protein [Microcoleus sp. HI-ES]